MENLVRLLMRFLLVPLGCIAAAIAEALFVFIVSWQRVGSTLGTDIKGQGADIFSNFLEDQFLLFMGLTVMLTPMLVGILISEALAIRSWIFHALNGAVSSLVGWQLFGGAGTRLVHPMILIATGIVGGFAYWAVAGFTAGFWKPVFQQDPPAGVPATTR
jgi:hypothetical protein